MFQFAVRQDRVILGVLAGMGIAAVPFFFKSVREREQQVHVMREGSFDKAEEQKHTSGR